MDASQLLADLAAMDSEAIDRENLLEKALLAGDDAGIEKLLDEWTEAEFKRGEDGG